MAPTTTHAGVISFISGLFSGQDVSAQTESVIEASSQTMTLPEPAMNIDPVVKVDGAVVIDGGEALLSEVGPSTAAPEKVDNSNGQISIYTVRSGDTLAEVAEMFDVSVNTILWANDMTKGSALKVGQSLVILPISGVMHTVVKGDTLNTITKKYAGDIDEIAVFNDLKVNSVLAIGDKIMIPDGQVSSSIRPSSVTNSTSRLISSAGGPDLGGYYMKPFIGGHKTQSLHGYNGVDYGMPVGSPLYAAAAGTVIIAKNSGYNGGYGDYVVIQHPNGTQTVYGHMSSVSVSPGQTLVQGQLIGYSGNTGKSTGPHLHFEIRGAKNPF
jgi:murein DD-endopeptidase MepM/ murein hydrolase activator NlpD